MAQKAKDVMTKHPKCCFESDSIHDAVKIMEGKDCGIVPVVDSEDKCIIGVVTDRDVCLEVVLKHRDPKNTQLSEIMSRNLLTCHPDDKLHDVIARMEKKQVRRIPVVDEKGRCVGIIAEADIALKDKDKKEVSELVGAVSRK